MSLLYPFHSEQARVTNIASHSSLEFIHLWHYIHMTHRLASLNFSTTASWINQTAAK